MERHTTNVMCSGRAAHRGRFGSSGRFALPVDAGLMHMEPGGDDFSRRQGGWLVDTQRTGMSAFL